jgi:hypothetical protein
MTVEEWLTTPVPYIILGWLVVSMLVVRFLEKEEEARVELELRIEERRNRLAQQVREKEERIARAYRAPDNSRERADLAVWYAEMVRSMDEYKQKKQEED